jgi:hypothetical protein
MTAAQISDDTIAVADFLRQRFGQDRIHLPSHVWGSFPWIQVAARAPDRFHACIGIGQVSFRLRSEVAARSFLLNRYRTLGKSAMVRRIMAAPAWLRLRDAAMQGAGVGTTRDMKSVITGVFLPVWRCPAYAISEKINIWRGLGFSRSFLWDFWQLNVPPMSPRLICRSVFSPAIPALRRPTPLPEPVSSCWGPR